jgi:hypothetical protein
MWLVLIWVCRNARLPDEKKAVGGKAYIKQKVAKTQGDFCDYKGTMCVYQIWSPLDELT